MILWVSEHLVKGMFPARRAYALRNEQVEHTQPGVRFIRLHSDEFCVVWLRGEPALRLSPETTEWIEIDRDVGSLEIKAVGEPEE